MQSIEINIINNSTNPLPVYETIGSSGMDLKANLEEPVKLEPMQRALIPTGLFIELPLGYEAQVRPRSGLAIKHGITCLNSPGTIDSDYRGEIKIILVNISNEPFIIQHGERIAQIIIQPVTKAIWQVVKVLSESKRGEGGFGHTGK
ncbi:MAG: dUTP diphosphatase [Parafilimonas sp.]|nr:dUTP diphosphatase [Parafilimonas sp.]